MIRADLRRGPYLVAGLGQAGGAALAALRRSDRCERLVAWDARGAPGVHGGVRALRRSHVRVFIGGDGREALAAAGARATVVKSPGLDPDLPLLQRARADGSEVIDELELGWRLRSQPVVGVTGTNGKSTTARLVAAVLDASGRQVALAGNFEFGPALCAAPRDGWLVVEASSFQLEAAPSFLPEVAVFTNLTLEHLPRHGSMERYGAAKRRLFVRGRNTAGVSVVCIDDAFGRTLASDVAAAGGVVLTYGTAAGADVRISAARWTVAALELSLDTPAGTLELSARLPGAHNAANVAAAVAVGQALGVDTPTIAGAIAGTAPLPGRWERIDRGQPFDVLVDYAHTPDGVRAVLEAGRAVADARGGRLHAVLGPVGLADPPKARGIAAAASTLSDRLTLTTGSAPRDERILRIQELRAACTGPATVDVRLDRRAAIGAAIAQAGSSDLVAILGIGALKRLILDRAGTVLPHDDRQAAHAGLRSAGWDR